RNEWAVALRCAAYVDAGERGGRGGRGRMVRWGAAYFGLDAETWKRQYYELAVQRNAAPCARPGTRGNPSGLAAKSLRLGR
ncbi:MAG: hypothetical protein RR022_02125, partial [Angelakisella sp.]